MKPRHRTAATAVLLAVGGGLVLAACAGGAATTAGRGGVATGSPPATTSSHSMAPLARAPAGPSAAPVAAGTVGESLVPVAPLVVRTGSISLGVTKSHVVSIFDEVSGDATDMGGFVASSSSTSAGDTGGASLVVRVPSEAFATLVSRVDSLGKVEAQSLNGDDVTGESIDIQASLENLRSEESALRALLSRAGSIPSILQVQNQLFGVQGDIEQLTAEESSLVNRATYATLDVQLSPLPVHKHKPAHHAASENALVRAVKLAGHNTAVALRAIVVALGWGFPVILLAALAFVIWRLQRRIVRRHPAAPRPLTE